MSLAIKILLLLMLVVDITGVAIGPGPFSVVVLAVLLGMFVVLPMTRRAAPAWIPPSVQSRTLERPPWLHVAFLSVLCLGLLPLVREKLGDGVREVVQAAAVIGVGWVVFASANDDERTWLRRGLAAICAALLVYGTISRTLCIDLPLRAPSIKVVAGMVNLFSSILTAWNSVICVIAGMLPVSDARLGLIMVLTLPFLIDQLRGRRDKYILVPVAMILLLLGCRNGGLLLCGIAGGIVSIVFRERQEAWQMIVAAATPLCIVMIIMGSIPWRTLQPCHPCRTVPGASADQTGDRPAVPREGAVKRLYLEYEALPGAVAAAPVFGHGLGQYKDVVRHYFVRFPDPADNKIVADTNSSYAVLAVEAGLPAALLLVVLLATIAGGAVRAAAKDREFAPMAGSAAALPFAALFTTIITRNTGMTVACSMALAAMCAQAVRRRVADESASPDHPISPPLRHPILRTWAPRLAVFCIAAIGCVIGSRFVGGTSSAVTARDAGDESSAQSPLIIDAAGTGHDQFILIEAEDTVSPPDGVMKICAANDSSGNSVLDIPLEAGKGKGAAAYRLTAPAGSYTIWLRAFWTDGCSNSIGCVIGEKEMIVSDERFKEWHWVSSPAQVELPGGPAELRLKNLEDGIMIDQILLTRDGRFVPHGIARAQ